MENNIRTLRRKLHISQGDLAAITRVSRQTINAIENDKYDPELTLAFRLARALDTEIDALFNYNSKEDVGKAEAYWCEKYKCVLLQSVDRSQNPGLKEIRLDS